MPRSSTSGQGRPKGVPNKITATLKDMVLGALEQAGGEGGGQAYLARQAEENPAAFMVLVGKVLPLPVTGDGGDPLIIRWDRNNDRKLDATGR
jgi:hypothetical protein